MLWCYVCVVACLHRYVLSRVKSGCQWMTLSLHLDQFICAFIYPILRILELLNAWFTYLCIYLCIYLFIQLTYSIVYCLSCSTLCSDNHIGPHFFPVCWVVSGLRNPRLQNPRQTVLSVWRWNFYLNPLSRQKHPQNTWHFPPSLLPIQSM